MARNPESLGQWSACSRSAASGVLPPSSFRRCASVVQFIHWYVRGCCGNLMMAMSPLHPCLRMIPDSHDRQPTTALAFIARWEQILYNIKQSYLVCAKNRAEVDFERDICQPVASLDRGDTDDPIEIVRQLLPPADRSMSREEIERIRLAPILVASVYCYRARQAVQQGDHDLGWTYLVDAGYWCAIARSGNSIGLAMQLAADEIRAQGVSVFSQEGNKAKRESLDLFIAEAYRLVRERKPTGSRWPKIVDAALAIQSHMLQFAKDKGMRAAPSNIQRRLCELLSKMPDAPDLFDTRG